MLFGDGEAKVLSGGAGTGHAGVIDDAGWLQELPISSGDRTDYPSYPEVTADGYAEPPW